MKINNIFAKIPAKPALKSLMKLARLQKGIWVEIEDRTRHPVPAGPSRRPAEARKPGLPLRSAGTHSELTSDHEVTFDARTFTEDFEWELPVRPCMLQRQPSLPG